MLNTKDTQKIDCFWEQIVIFIAFIGKSLLVVAMTILMLEAALYIIALPSEFIHLISGGNGIDITKLTVEIFHIIDVVLIITFALMTTLIIFQQYVYHSDYITKHYAWAEHISHSDLKVKIADALVAITSIKLLGYAMALGTVNFDLTTEGVKDTVIYAAGLHMVLLISAFIVKIMHYIEVASIDKKYKSMETHGKSTHHW